MSNVQIFFINTNQNEVMCVGCAFRHIEPSYVQNFITSPTKETVCINCGVTYKAPKEKKPPMYETIAPKDIKENMTIKVSNVLYRVNSCKKESSFDFWTLELVSRKTATTIVKTVPGTKNFQRKMR